VQFQVSCNNCDSSYEIRNHQIFVRNDTEMITIAKSNKIDRDVTLEFNVTSFFPSGVKDLSATLSVTLSPCFSGYTHSANSKICECYQDDDDVIQCRRDGANARVEIRQGYWFGSVLEKRTVSLCPNFYCDFSDRIETGNGYYNLPRELDDQCRPHRTGVACGDCSSGYTLSYDSPDCISQHKCSPFITAVGVMLTILYWIAIVTAVFVLMFYKFQVSLGYLYGIIYFYSVVDILLDNNLYVTSGVFQLVAVLSSFAKLSPQLFGELCFIEGLSRIDQQFIHYSHAVAISLFLVVITVVARHFPRVAFYVRRCIIRVICLLLLLAYTSLASTSLQLLKPQHFAGVDEVFVYLSPSHKYLRGRHAFYGIVAALCGLFIVIGLPLLLLLQPFINSKVNFIKIMPLLEQAQSCYKSKYRYFASYYLICRLAIILIVFIGDSNYYSMLF